MRECVVAFIVKGKRILLGKRSVAREFYPDVWDAFGGHLNPNESCEDALRRELHEELGIIPTRWTFLMTADEPDPVANGKGQYHIYLVTRWDGVPTNMQLEEHSLVEWFEFERAMNLPFPHPLYTKVIEQIEQAIERRQAYEIIKISRKILR